MLNILEKLRIIGCCYTIQRNSVRCGDVLSGEYGLEYGVRQGGLISLRLFNLYVDALIGEFSSTQVRYHVGRVCFNNINHADDMVLLSLSICETSICANRTP